MASTWAKEKDGAKARAKGLELEKDKVRELPSGIIHCLAAWIIAPTAYVDTFAGAALVIKMPTNWARVESFTPFSLVYLPAYQPSCRYILIKRKDNGYESASKILQNLKDLKIDLSDCFQRNELREQQQIEGSTMSDALASICCPCCVTVQVANELDSLGK